MTKSPQTVANCKFQDGVIAGRLDADAYNDNFSDLHPPYSQFEAKAAADRCYFCYDAPCTIACPTEIDIPMFIRQIATDNVLGSAKTIFDQNILGGMCARVCPTETLCEQACVRETAESKPVEIGRLQRYATDKAITDKKYFYKAAQATGKSVAVVGAGPAGLACAHELAKNGHQVIILEAKSKNGGLNEYGIAAYKTVDNFAQAEIDYILSVGGIQIKNDSALGHDYQLDDLQKDYDAVFLGLGLGDTNDLDNDLANNLDREATNAVDYIAQIRQAKDLATLPVARHLVVIGGGMTAIDVAIQAKLLGAETVTLCYRREQSKMNASQWEQDLAAAKGVILKYNLQPEKIETQDGKLKAITMRYTQTVDGKLVASQETLTLEAQQVFAAIGQSISSDLSEMGLAFDAGRIKIDGNGKTNLDKIWAGGDCAAGGDDLTVSAVAMGRDAAKNIHANITG